ncbi:phosphate/phosphite/phosphonate ABC transporter substrate-binding protein [Loktanella sp. SALINAS62]|uniref:phosphate/phosphite/phosphonate ABC transporter substrate-binding protein n=1 Tax=Loktanella sp. SALINAS62 TaxID=2706124 RepID=UPI001B8CCBC3|nr:phosphate/phosphite/phosphonate ABC transporter substrate-binding protein [Loktanella sp. SALINAS62]MBS1300926.1 phosphate/phosphite/phosphonate ABC transporter substrate-binding protein [Loktanella sp. SALINAS62]
MNSTYRVAFGVAATAALFAGQASAQSVGEVCPSPLRMADTGIEGMGDLTEAFGPFAKTFEELTGVELALYSLSNRTAAGTALQFDEVEFVFAGPSEFVLFQQLAEMDILFSVVRPNYGSSFVVKADSEIKTLADLAGKRVALKDVGSTSGHIFPMMLMAQAGLDPETDAEIIMAGDARIQVLINDDVDAMGGGNKDWDAVREQDPDTEYRLLAQTDTLPGDPVVMRASLPQECRDALRSTLAEHADVLWDSLTSTERNADKFIERDAYMSFETDPAIYDIVREAYTVAGIPLDD